ncbi:MAG: squalene/phytoene synthase family protein [Alphaproteobacteria bacterium]|nr:squalene/phytoene synthase family protein [Alphaproteobacteria bacterium]
MLSVGDIVKKVQPSLFWCMRGIERSKREAIYTLFAFCRHLDNIVRSSMPLAEKMELLSAWQEELDNIYDKKVPATNIGRKIYKNCIRFDLPKDAWMAILQSAMTNVESPLLAPDVKTFDEYLQGAGIVPMRLALAVLSNSHPSANNELARYLGRAVVLTYILRDVKDDAKSGRFYIPNEVLEMAHIVKDEPRMMVEDKNLYLAREILSVQAEKSFGNADRLLSKMSKRDVMPLRLIKNVCHCQFDMMKNRGWEIISPKPKINLIKSLDIMYQTMFK